MEMKISKVILLLMRVKGVVKANKDIIDYYFYINQSINTHC